MVTQELSIHEQAVSGKQDSGEIMNLPYHSRVIAPGYPQGLITGGAQPARQPAKAPSQKNSSPAERMDGGTFGGEQPVMHLRKGGRLRKAGIAGERLGVPAPARFCPVPTGARPRGSAAN